MPSPRPPPLTMTGEGARDTGHVHGARERGQWASSAASLSRETAYVYGTNNVPDPDPATGSGIDLLQVKVRNAASPGAWDVTASYTYNAQHQPLTVTDAAGQTTSYTYDAQSRVQTVTTPPRAPASPSSGRPPTPTTRRRATWPASPLRGT